jgi:hypothetical protein
MGRIIYKGRGVSHIYLWVTIAFYELSAATHPQAKTPCPLQSIKAPDHIGTKKGHQIPFDSHESQAPLLDEIHRSLPAQLKRA